MNNFGISSYFKLRKKNVEEIKVYYQKVKSELLYNNNYKSSHKITNKLNTLKLLALKSIRIISRNKLNLYTYNNDNEEVVIKKVRKYNLKLDEPTIIVFTHICMEDLQILSEAIKLPFSLLCGDPEHTLGKMPDHLFMWLNNSIYVDSEDVYDNAYTLKLLQDRVTIDKQHIVISPEGTWFFIEKNGYCYPIKDGAAITALETNAKILPIGIYRDNKDYHVILDENLENRINPLKCDDTKKTSKKEKIKSISGEIFQKFCDYKHELYNINKCTRTYLSLNDIKLKYKVNTSSLSEEILNNYDYVDHEGNALYDTHYILFEIEKQNIINEWVDKNDKPIYTEDIIRRRIKQ